MHARACACARQALAKLESSAKDTPIFIVDAFTAPGAAPCLTGKSLRRHLAIIPCACAQQARASFALASRSLRLSVCLAARRWRNCAGNPAAVCVLPDVSAAVAEPTDAWMLGAP